MRKNLCWAKAGEPTSPSAPKAEPSASTCRRLTYGIIAFYLPKAGRLRGRPADFLFLLQRLLRVDCRKLAGHGGCGARAAAVPQPRSITGPRVVSFRAAA